MITALLAALFSGTALMAQPSHEEYLGLPGDNLNLYAVMKLFQESKTLEEFERNLNDPKNNINNLDLNNDNLVDYIKVNDNIDGNVHNIVLQVAVSPRENQDVAVFTVQRFANGQVQIQLTGDDELYGKDYIIEPRYDDVAETPNPGYNGEAITYYRTTPVEIAAWPIVRFVYLPGYTRWHSSWYWGYYPTYWHPWQPFSWHYYYGYHYNWYHDYYGHYRMWNYHRDSHWNDSYYRNTRSYSPEVEHWKQQGIYKTTYSHPEERRNGEALFAKNYPDRYKSNNDHGNSSNVSRRNSTTVTNRNVDNHPANNNNVSNPNTTRRTTTTVTNRSVNTSTAPATRHNESVTRTVTRKSQTPPASQPNVTTAPRSNVTTAPRPNVNTTPRTNQNFKSNRSSSQSQPSSVNSSNRRTKSESAKKTQNSKKNSDSDNSDRRR